MIFKERFNFFFFLVSSSVTMSPLLSLHIVRSENLIDLCLVCLVWLLGKVGT